MKNWIKTNERLPCKGQLVLVPHIYFSTNKKTISVMVYEPRDGRNEKECFLLVNECCGNDWFSSDFWMPLPQYPED